MEIEECQHCKQVIYFDDTVNLWSHSKIWLEVVCEENKSYPKKHEPRIGYFGGNHS